MVEGNEQRGQMNAEQASTGVSRLAVPTTYDEAETIFNNIEKVKSLKMTEEEHLDLEIRSVMAAAAFEFLRFQEEELMLTVEHRERAERAKNVE
jgi:DNA replication protein DnaD